MVSEPWDFMGAGMDTLFNWPEAVAVTGNRGAVDVEAQQKGQGFSFGFAAPSGRELEVGEYAGAEQNPIKGRPGISVSGDGRGCDLTFGRFVVKDIHFGASGSLERFWALYEQHCERAEEPALFGEISYGEPPTAAPELVQPSAIDWPRTRVASSARVPVTVTAGESGAQVTSISLAGANPAEFAIANDTCTGTTLAPRAACQIALSAKPAAAGSAQLILTDKSGAKTIVSLRAGTEPASGPAPIESSGSVEEAAKEPKEEASTGGSATASGTGPVSGASSVGSGSTGGVLGHTEPNIGSDQVAAILRQELVPTGGASKIATVVKAGGFAVNFRALTPGAVAIDWYCVPSGAHLSKKFKGRRLLVASGHMAFSSARSAEIKVKLTSAGMRLLKTVDSLRLTARGTFVSRGNPTVNATKVFVLKR